jgi:hypothetical protein
LKTSTILARLVFGATALFALGDSIAQIPGGMPGRGMPQGRGGQIRQDQAQPRTPPQENVAEQMDFRLYQLREDLKLMPEQERAWSDYAARVRALGADVARDRERWGRVEAQVDSLQRIERLADAARNRLTAIEDIAIAAKALYERLSAQQRSVAEPRLANFVRFAQEAAPVETTRPNDGSGRSRDGR